MRGKACFFQLGEVPAGITPAYAGKSVKLHELFFCRRDHPRLCGEKPFPHFSTLFRWGSPPPMRGKGIHIIWSKNHFRITPAYAGKSNLNFPLKFIIWDHPRLCGEKPPTYCVKICRTGSPPPMRGKVFDHRKNQFDVGITPAYAGKSSGEKLVLLSYEDHPRLCGEKSATTSGGISGSGSPPPMRGKVFTGFFQCYSCRITPAYAGKSRVEILTR